MSTEGKNIFCTNREIMHLCQVNKIGQYFKYQSIIIFSNVSMAIPEYQSIKLHMQALDSSNTALCNFWVFWQHQWKVVIKRVGVKKVSLNSMGSHKNALMRL